MQVRSWLLVLKLLIWTRLLVLRGRAATIPAHRVILSRQAAVLGGHVRPILNVLVEVADVASNLFPWLEREGNNGLEVARSASFYTEEWMSAAYDEAECEPLPNAIVLARIQ